MNRLKSSSVGPSPAKGRRYYFLTGKMPLNGFLDRMRENLETLDEQIENARVMSKKKGKDANPLQWTKTLRDLIELRSVQLDKIKAHLLGRDETGVVKEPEDCWDENPQVEYERYFKNQLLPWTMQDLKLKCKDCGVESEDVSNHYFPEERDKYYRVVKESESVNLCLKSWLRQLRKNVWIGKSSKVAT